MCATAKEGRQVSDASDTPWRGVVPGRAGMNALIDPSRPRRTRSAAVRLAIGGVCGLAWAESDIGWYGTFAQILLPGVVAGVLLGWAEHIREIFAGFGFMLLLFPSGTLPSPRWRPFAGLGLLATALTMAGFVVRPRLVALPAPGGVSLMFPNPLGIRSLGPVFSTVLIGTLNGLSVLGTVLLAAAFVSLAIRYRSGGREVRQQIKWIALAAVAGFYCQLVALLATAASGDASNPVTVTAYIVMPVIALFVVPAIITLAILKHGLYQIDVIISRAVMYGLLSAVLTAVYAGIVVGIGTLAGYAGGPFLTVAAAVAVALLFQPVRRRAQLVAATRRANNSAHPAGGRRRRPRRSEARDGPAPQWAPRGTR